jgi:hypothetical protein
MNRSRLRFPGRAGLLACALGMVAIPAAGQEPQPGPMTPAKGAPANFDPSDVYFQGWLLSRDAEKLQAEKKHAEALEKLIRARQLFESVSAYFPLWKPEMVKGRREKTQDIIDVVGPLALQENQAKQRSLAELEGGARTGVIEGEPPRPLNGGLPLAPMQPTQELETLETRRIAELEARVKELQADLSASRNPGSAERQASRARDLEKQRDLARAELQRSQDELRRLRSRYQSEPMQQELRNLADQLQAKERERAAIAQALSQSQQETREAKAQADALNIERGRLAQKAADLERNLEQERKLQSEVIAAQQRQLRALQQELRGRNDDLAKANQRIAGLELQLSEMKQSYDELREERDGLLRERDQMAALLKLNEGSQIQQLIDQNMGLAKQLREANEKVDRLNKDHNATQDQLLEAMRDLAIAKGNINNFKREKAAQDKRIAELERRLRSEAASLPGGGDPAEVQMLRGIIQKQLRIQERRRQSTELLVDALGDLAEKDPKVKDAVALLDGNELKLTPKEMDVLKDDGVDVEFNSPFRRSQGEVDASVAELEGGNRPFIEAISRAFLANRFESSRELSEMVLERNPGDTATMCRLGVIHLRLNQPDDAAQAFRNATVIDNANPFAHRMLGYTLMETGDYGEALEALKRSVDLAPTHAETRVILGKLQFDLGDEEAAERELKSAIDFDDTLPEPHFNLAYLYAKQGKKQQGREYYRNALERGAEADLDLERRLGE